MEIVIPCAGRSERYPNTLPKYLLKMNDGRFMFQLVSDEYVKKGLKVTFILLKEHIKLFDAKNIISQTLNSKKINISVLNRITKGPAETVYSYVKKLNKPIMIQDCDSFFKTKVVPKNKIDVVDLRSYPELSNISAKSFVYIDSNNIVKDIFEKQVVSNFVCCGGYSFESSKIYSSAFKKISNMKYKEVFVSHVIKDCLSTNIFNSNVVTDYFDIGTLQEFKQYKYQGRMIFVDFNDVVLDNSNKINKQNLDYFLKIQNNNSVKFIFLTAFNKLQISKYIKQLNKNGLKNFSFIDSVPYAPKEFYINYYNQGPENEILIKPFIN
tara:strand:- start:419 stop:1390 length:972 start_codon:yes stop_codon:yes gene_type:complete